MPKYSLIACLTILVCGIIGSGIYYIHKLQVSISQLSLQQETLSGGISKVQAITVSKQELDRLAKIIGIDINTIKDDLRLIDGKLIAVGSSIARIQGSISQDQSSDSSTPNNPPPQPPSGECKLCDIYNYTANKQHKYFKLETLTIGSITFDASKKNPWTTELYPLNYQTRVALAQKPDESFILYSQTSIERVDGKEQPLVFSLESQLYQVIKPKKQWHWWAPHLDLSLDNNFRFQSDFYKFGVSLGWSPFAYGRTINDNSWRLLRIGIGLDSEYIPNVSVHPIQYNIGDLLPLLSDAWLSVGLTYNLNFGIVLSLGTTL